MISQSEALEALYRVEDPELGMNIVDLGLVYGLVLDDEAQEVRIDLTLTSPGCPFGPELIRAIKRELEALDPGMAVDVDLVWKPLWNPSMMSEFAKDELGYDEELGLNLGY
jgi:metal-sulfur cluster biosynthetic enzyme